MTTTLSGIGEIFDGPHATPKRLTSGSKTFLNISSLNQGRLDLDQSDWISDDEFTKWTRRVTPQPGDLLFSYETRLGEAALMPTGIDACLGRRMALLRPDTTVVDSQFLLYFWMSPYFKQLINQRAIHGATVDRIPLSELGDWPVTLPTLKDQHAIAEVLGALDDKIAANSCAMSTVFNLCLSLAQKATQGTSESTLGKVSKSISRGSAPKYADNGYLVLNQKCIRNGRVDTSAGRISYKLPRNPEKVLQAEDILVNSTGQGTLGRVARWTHDIDDVSTDSHVSIVRIDPKLADPTFVGTLVLHKELQIEGFAEGSTGQTELRRDSLAALPLRLPSINRQREVGDQIRTLWSLLDSLEDQSRTLAATRDELLPLLMSGKITVADAEKRITE